jgi:uncharacterized coiled-coil DUF342 family protein
MTRIGKVLIVVVVATLGLWGCARNPAGQTGQADKVRLLEGQCAKLQGDYRNAAAARDQARQQMGSLRDERARLLNERDQLQKKLAAQQQLRRERDELRREINSRTSERDALRDRCDRLKRGLQELLGQDNAVLPSGVIAPSQS